MKVIVKDEMVSNVYPNDDAKTFKTAGGFELLRINRQVKPLHGWMFVDTDSVLMYIAETFGSEPVEISYVIKNTGTVLFDNKKKVQSYYDVASGQVFLPGGYDREKTFQDSEYLNRRKSLVESRILHEFYHRLILIPNCVVAEAAAIFTGQGFVMHHKCLMKKRLDN